jgi:hypothetical protein
VRWSAPPGRRTAHHARCSICAADASTGTRLTTVPVGRSQACAGTDRYVRGLLLAVLRAAPGPFTGGHSSTPRRTPSCVTGAQRDRCLDALVADGLVEPATGDRRPVPAAPVGPGQVSSVRANAGRSLPFGRGTRRARSVSGVSLPGVSAPDGERAAAGSAQSHRNLAALRHPLRERAIAAGSSADPCRRFVEVAAEMSGASPNDTPASFQDLTNGKPSGRQATRQEHTSRPRHLDEPDSRDNASPAPPGHPRRESRDPTFAGPLESLASSALRRR